MTKFTTLILGFILIGLIIWWFFGKHQTKIEEAKIEKNKNKQIINIKVNGGYSPEKIIVKKGVTTELRFLKIDNSSCLDYIVFPYFDINKFLPRNKTISIKINTNQAGEFEWFCGMHMFHGKLIVK